MIGEFRNSEVLGRQRRINTGCQVEERSQHVATERFDMRNPTREAYGGFANEAQVRAVPVFLVERPVNGSEDFERISEVADVSALSG